MRPRCTALSGFPQGELIGCGAGLRNVEPEIQGEGPGDAPMETDENAPVFSGADSAPDVPTELPSGMP